MMSFLTHLMNYGKKAEQADDNEAQCKWQRLEDDKDNLDQKIAMCDLAIYHF
jgi:hypothetical protein